MRCLPGEIIIILVMVDVTIGHGEMKSKHHNYHTLVLTSHNIIATLVLIIIHNISTLNSHYYTVYTVIFEGLVFRRRQV